MIRPELVQVVAIGIFFVGVLGLMLRRNLIVNLMCIELMLNAVNLSFVGFGKANGDLAGEISVFFIMVVAAAESAVGLGLIIALFRNVRRVDSSEIELLRY